MSKPKVCILRTAGTNCDKETAFAFSLVGAQAEFVHVNAFIDGNRNLSEFKILALSGGFSYGDDIAAGKILANELRFRMKADIRKFINDGKLIIGICNGFQILVKAGLLPGNADFIQEASLIINDSAKFEARWVHLKSALENTLKSIEYGVQSTDRCVWAKNLPDVIYLPVAHGEGKFIASDKSVLEKLNKNHQIVFKYCDEAGEHKGYPYNPNGSIQDIAGICDESGRILGLMPHPERHVQACQHPRWTGPRQINKEGDGLQIFRNGVEYVRENL